MTILESERVDDLGRRGYQIIQNTKKFCFGVDAVLLSWFAEARAGEKIVDLGTGTGIIPILMDARYAAGDYTGLEIQEEMAEMATRSAELNQIQDHMHFVQGDIKEAAKLLGKAQYDVVTTNPPYMPASHGLVNPDMSKAVSRHEILCNLDDVIREASALLKRGGRFYMIHRPMRLSGILTRMEEYHLAPTEIRFVHPYMDKEATMVLIHGVKGGKSMLKTLPPLIMYDAPNQYTEEVRKIYQE